MKTFVNCYCNAKYHINNQISLPSVLIRSLKFNNCTKIYANSIQGDSISGGIRIHIFSFAATFCLYFFFFFLSFLSFVARGLYHHVVGSNVDEWSINVPLSGQ